MGQCSPQGCAWPLPDHNHRCCLDAKMDLSQRAQQITPSTNTPYDHSLGLEKLGAAQGSVEWAVAALHQGNTSCQAMQTAGTFTEQ